MNLEQKYDAIVIGTGISGGWAAKELCEGGLKTLVLERGRMVKHIEDYPTMNKDPWDFELRGGSSQEDQKKQEKQSRTGYTTHPQSRHWFVNDLKHPYNETKRFDWMRGYHVGGRSIMWGRHCYRLSDLDFEANKKDGYGVDWPIRYKDIAPWYDKVEEYIGLSGEAMGLPQLPDGKFLPPIEMNCVETHLKESMSENYADRVLTVGRIAHITTKDKKFEGRTACQYRNRCIRGCPFGGYFSSNSSTLPAAERTGNMTLRPHSIAYEIVYDDTQKKATGVKIIDAKTKEKMTFDADIIFCCASAIPSASILMQSKSERFPNGLGNDSDQLGRNIMDHHLGAGARGKTNDYKDRYYKGRRPGGIYLPRFRNLGDKATENKNFLRGYGYQGGAGRGNISELVAEAGYGADLTNTMLDPGSWSITLFGFGECLPYQDNRMTLDYEKLDEWGLPTVTFDAEWKENEYKMREDMIAQAVDMLEKAGFEDIETIDRVHAPGIGIHEMGTARMGRNPKTSVLNLNNQIHTVPNVYVTDGACMTSAGCTNPSITYMALTARAANHAVSEFKKMKAKA